VIVNIEIQIFYGFHRVTAFGVKTDQNTVFKRFLAPNSYRNGEIISKKTPSFGLFSNIGIKMEIHYPFHRQITNRIVSALIEEFPFNKEIISFLKVISHG